MATVNFELRKYQDEALRTLRAYLRKVVKFDGIADNPAKAAFTDVAEASYWSAQFINEQTPYICIRIPTGGGKTIVAAHSVGVVAKEYLHADNPMVLWLVPSTAILDQTLTALRDQDHPYRAALAAEFGRNLSVLTVAEALALSHPDAAGGACIIVSTLQAFRVDDTTGRKVYADAGALMDHFSGLSPAQMARLERVEGTDRPVASLANVLRLHRPMVIVDEAHNARSALSFDTLSRFDPSLILEFTATPQLKKDVDREIYPSNILFHVSAAELKAEEMIKLPIALKTDEDWRKVIGMAYDCQLALEKVAQAEEADTGEYIRPIILFQAQSKSAADPHRLTPEAVVQFLTDDKRIPRDQIAIHATGHAELDAIPDIFAKDCPVRYVVTVQKLREGWDCPFAYILCSVAELSSPTAVEQILGRVLRMPKARRKTRDALNRAYAFVASNNFQTVAERLKDGLVDAAGFDRMEAEQLIKGHDAFEFEDEKVGFVHKSDALPDAPSATVEAVQEAIEKLPARLRARVEFDPVTREIGVKRALSGEERKWMHLAFAKVQGAEKVIDRLFIRSNRIQASATPQDQKPPFIVPRLGIRRQGILELFGPDHFLDLPWNLADCGVGPWAARFNIRGDTQSGIIDVSDKGKMKIAFVGEVHDQLSMTIQEPTWTLPRLVNWIDRGIPHPDVTKPAARVFINHALEEVMKVKGYTLDQLARYKYEARRSLGDEIQSLRAEREESKFKALFAADASEFETSADLALIFDEQSYAYNQPYKGSRTFRRHYFPIIGDLKPEGEEFRCATFLDDHPKVRYWVRNVDRKPNAFWLQLSRGRFFPDFVAMLTDGRILVVEYKGKHLAEDAKEKRLVGELWAEASEHQCLFAMPTDTGFSDLTNMLKR